MDKFPRTETEELRAERLACDAGQGRWALINTNVRRPLTEHTDLWGFTEAYFTDNELVGDWKPVAVPKGTVEGQKSDAYRCPVVTCSFGADRRTVIGHLAGAHLMRRWRCPACEEVFLQTRYARNHLKAKCGESKKAAPSKGASKRAHSPAAGRGGPSKRKA